MPPTGSNFTDWQQVEKESRLLIDEDFSWSEPPQRRRRRMTEDAAPTRSTPEDEPIRVGRRIAVLDYEPEYAEDAYESYAEAAPAPVEHQWDQATAVHSHFDEMMAEWNANYGSSAEREPAERAFDLSDPGDSGSHGSRRTVLITGHGDERYLPAPRQRRSSGLRFHERSGFSPDRLGLWAVLLSIALVIGAVAH